MSEESKEPAAAVAEKLVELAEAAKTAGVPRTWLRAETDAGRIPALRVGPKVLYRLTAVRAALLAAASGMSPRHTPRSRPPADKTRLDGPDDGATDTVAHP